MQNKKQNQRGDVAIFLSIIALLLLLIVGATVSFLMIGQLKMSSQEGQSIKAFYAAESGAEKCLYQAKNGTSTDPCFGVNSPLTGTLSTSATYTAVQTASTSTSSTINSLGTFGSANRKVEFTWQK